MFARYLRRQRQLLGISQEEAADAVGVDRSQWNAWENGRRGIQGDNVDKVAAFLGVTPTEIYELADEPGAMAELAVQLAELERRVGDLEEQR